MTPDIMRALARLHLDVAHALYEQRERAGLSVERLAEIAGIAPERILMIEEGDTTSLTEVAQLCTALGIDLNEVFPQPQLDSEKTRIGSAWPKKSLRRQNAPSVHFALVPTTDPTSSDLVSATIRRRLASNARKRTALHDWAWSINDALGTREYR